MSYGPEDIVTADDTNAEHAKFCLDLQARSGGFYNEGPFTPYVYRAPGAKPYSYDYFSGRDRRHQLGRRRGRCRTWGISS